MVKEKQEYLRDVCKNILRKANVPLTLREIGHEMIGVGIKRTVYSLSQAITGDKEIRKTYSGVEQRMLYMTPEVYKRDFIKKDTLHYKPRAKKVQVNDLPPMPRSKKAVVNKVVEIVKDEQIPKPNKVTLFYPENTERNMDGDKKFKEDAEKMYRENMEMIRKREKKK